MSVGSAVSTFGPGMGHDKPRPLAPLPSADRRRLCGDKPMPDPAARPDVIDQADVLFRNPPTLEELMADVPPLTSEDDLAIPGLTDEEWEAFVAALNDE